VTPTPFNVGVFVLGAPTSPRALVRHADLFAAYADGTMAERGEDREAYLSHFVFGEEIQRHFAANRNSVAGFVGPCCVAWLLWDIDEPDPVAALTSARRLVAFIQERYHTDPAVWFSGAKGYHVGLRLAHDPSPSATFPTVARSFAQFLADGAGVAIDESLYDRARIVRLPNTKHPKTGLFKRRIDLDILPFFSPEALREHCAEPAGDGLPRWDGNTDRLAADWAVVEARVGRAAQARAERRAEFVPDTRAPRYFWEFVRFGVPEGERATMLFRCAAWLSEQGAPPSLTRALLTEPALDSGLLPSEVQRQIRCGIEHAQRQRSGNAVVAEAPAQAPAVVEADPDADPDAFEAWAIRHEDDPWPPPTFPFGANAPIEETSAEPTPALADVPTQSTIAARWRAILERLTGDPQAVRQALQQLSISGADPTKDPKGD